MLCVAVATKTCMTNLKFVFLSTFFISLRYSRECFLAFRRVDIAGCSDWKFPIAILNLWAFSLAGAYATAVFRRFCVFSLSLSLESEWTTAISRGVLCATHRLWQQRRRDAAQSQRRQQPVRVCMSRVSVRADYLPSRFCSRARDAYRDARVRGYVGSTLDPLNRSHSILGCVYVWSGTFALSLCRSCCRRRRRHQRQRAKGRQMRCCGLVFQRMYMFRQAEEQVASWFCSVQ